MFGNVTQVAEVEKFFWHSRANHIFLARVVRHSLAVTWVSRISVST
jgi:hypothetical protein